MASTRRRVKVYTLNEDRQWDDRGTGHVSSSYVERLQGMSIMVRSEEDGSILLESKIQPHTAYQKQQETLIVWSEGENCDLALSFQEKAGCDEIWAKICQEDEKFLTDLFMQLTDEDTSEERRKDLVSFLKELVSFSTQLQVHQKDEFFKCLSHHGLLPALEMLMDMLMNQIIDYMIGDGDTGNAYQLAQLIRTLLDPENMALGPNKMEKTEFLSFFYKHSMHVLTAPLFAATSDFKYHKDDYVSSVTLSHILELLTFCIEHHTYHIKNYVISKDLLKRALITMKSKHKFLVLNALRFCRKIVGLKDEFYNRYIMKGTLFEGIITAFKENGNRYNLLNSAIVELFEFIRVEDIKSLCTHVCEEYNEFFEEVNYVSTFKGLLLRMEQENDRKQNNKISERGNNHGIIHVNSRFRRDARAMEEDEETWFDQGEEENGDETVLPANDDFPLDNDEREFKTRKSFISTKSNKLSSDTQQPAIVINKTEDIKSLCTHVCEEYNEFFEDVNYVSTFKGLLLRMEQENDRKQNNKISESARAMEEDEETWFDQGEEENGDETVLPSNDDFPLDNDEREFKTRKSFISTKSNKLSSDTQQPAIVINKTPLMGLVDYPDDDEDDDDEDSISPAKRMRLNSS
ncbi:hypothetical protein QZH41_015123 [Actinostola sp. cb2023]|nr:hypothetical protein QZH41_015123 [Actinostola sp. cb2023]